MAEEAHAIATKRNVGWARCDAHDSTEPACPERAHRVNVTRLVLALLRAMKDEHDRHRA